MLYYDIAPLKVVRAGADFLTYQSENRLSIGAIVQVPVGKSMLVGVVFRAVRKKPRFTCKAVSGVVEDQPLPGHLLDASLWLSKFYATPLATVLQTVLPAGLTKTRREKTKNQERSSAKAKTPALPLNSDQEAAVRSIESSYKSTVLLHGVTGSGKTNVYIALAKKVLARAQSVIVLTPEISLTPQLVSNFEQHFSEEVILLHSRQTEAERHILWRKILNGEQHLIIIGPRSALFAPLRNLGLIIVDEAHEPSYHQDQNPKYSALRVASMMAKSGSFKAVFGTATPLLADHHLAHKNHSIVELKKVAKANQKRVNLQIVDLKNRDNFRRHYFLSDALLASISSSLKSGKQSLVFHNRRGSASLTLCNQCGWQALCPNCLLPLTLHGDKYQYICHTCGYKQPVATVCPSCGNTDVVHKGFGTKAVELELQKVFPDVRIARFDSDTPEELSMNKLFIQVRDGDIPIIIGTQSIVKGFDLPNLGTVGVVQADLGLSLPDFSSDERTFQLLTQVVGRVGRGHSDADVIIQSFQPSNKIVQYGCAQDYAGFHDEVMKARYRAGFPPFRYLLKLTCVRKTEASAVKNCREAARDIKNWAEKTGRTVEVSSPAPAFYERTKTTYRWQLVIKSRSRKNLTDLLAALPLNNWLIDLDPPSLL